MNGTDIELIRRTQCILNQYDKYVRVPIRKKNIRDEKSYSHTLFINACLSLLILLQNRLDKDQTIGNATEDWGIQDKDITLCCNTAGEEEKTIREICRHLRNSLSHSRFSFDEKESVLSMLHFKDKNDRGLNFDMSISFKKFKGFVEELCKWALSVE